MGATWSRDACLVVRALDWSDELGADYTTIVVEVVYHFSEEGVVTPVHSPGPPLTPESIAPWKAFAEVHVVGDRGGSRGVSGLSVARGPVVSIWKRLVRLRDDGPLLHPDPDAQALGLAPTLDRLALDAPERRRFLAGVGAPHRGAERLIVPRGLDLRYFQDAPADQWAGDWRGGERILLAGFGRAQRVLRLPAVCAHAALQDGPRVAMRGDTLSIDVERSLVTVCHRGVVRGGLASHGGLAALHCGLHPSEDAEATLAEPIDWIRPEPSRAGRRSPSVSNWTIQADELFAVGQSISPVRASERPKHPQAPPRSLPARRTLIAKASFHLGGPGLAELAPPAPLAVPRVVDGRVVGPSDHAPLKLFAEVLLTGSAYPGKSREREATRATVALTVRAPAVGPVMARTFHKELVALGPREWLPDGRPGPAAPFERLALAEETDSGALPRRLENPDDVERARQERRAPAGFGAVPPSAQRCQASTTSDWPSLPGDFDPSHFQSAPLDQRLADVDGATVAASRAGWERGHVSVTSVRPGGGAISGTLPGIRPRAALLLDDRPPAEVELTLDTLTIDAESALVHLVWRGHYESLMGAARQDERVVVVAESAERPLGVERLFVSAHVACDPLWAKAPRGLDVPGGAAPAGETIARWLANPPSSPSTAARKAPPARPPAPTRESVLGWIARRESLVGRDLSHVDLSGAALAGADLAGAILAFANLEGADLTGAALARASLIGASLADARLDEADLRGADLTGAKLMRSTARGARVERAVFSDADLRDVGFDRAEGSGARLTSANVCGGTFVEARLPGSDWTRASLERARFDRATLSAARFDECRAPGARFEGAQLSRASFEGAELVAASFQGADAADASWECADLTRAVLSSAKLSSARLDGAKLMEADLRGATGLDPSAREADFSRANLAGAAFERASLEAAIFDDSNLSDAALVDPDLWLASTPTARR